MTHTTTVHSTEHVAHALRDGLIVILGLTITVGTFFNSEITMWAAGA